MHVVGPNKYKSFQAIVENNVKVFFHLLLCSIFKTKKHFHGFKETDAYPADPEDGYGWEKIFSERMCRHFTEDFGIETRIARYHNIFGPSGTFDGGREKAPAALCRKIIQAKKKNSKYIDVWGDGEQTRSFLYIDDYKRNFDVFNHTKHDIFNIEVKNKFQLIK